MKKANQNKSSIRLSVGDRTYYIIVTAVLTLFGMLVLIPVINIVACSFSSPSAVSNGRVGLVPVEFSLRGYEEVFQYRGIWQAYGYTFFYTVAGTAINLTLTMLAAYPMASRRLPFRNALMFLFTFTMLFSGGMIPSYINILNLGINNTVWAILLPTGMSVYNMIIARTFIRGIPEEIEEAASIDGCNQTQYFFQMVLPLSKTVMSVLMLYYAVGHWNDYMSAFLYLNDRDMYPLQMLLREILIANSIPLDAMVDSETVKAMYGMSDLLRYSLIIVSSVPVLVMYPFVKKYFLKGVMLGSIKG